MQLALIALGVTLMVAFVGHAVASGFGAGAYALVQQAVAGEQRRAAKPLD